ncbi:Tubulin like, partial [Halovenus aranensis]
MPRCKTPDVLIGLGGGGSKVVYRYMQQEWLLEEVFETDDYAQDDPGKLHAITIDTAQDDVWQDERAEDAINTIHKVLPDKYNTNDGILELNGYPKEKSAKPTIIPEMVGNAWTGQNLTDPVAIGDLLNRTGLRSWWLEENKEPISNFDAEGAFSGGVLRNRSVSKALYHVAEGTDNSVVPDHNPDDHVAVVAALGGGTGSGMILDLAEELTAQTKHLYAIIPNENARKNELANAHSALSELEYLQLTDELPFATV